MKIRFYGIILLVMAFALGAKAQTKRNSAYQAYIERYKDIAIEQMLEHHIPASITLAQGLLESRAGLSPLATQGNNHFGIKCHLDWTGETMYQDDDEQHECFRVYNTARESYEDHSKFLKKPRYQVLYSYSTTDYKSWAYGLKQCGYATSPTYAQKLIGIIETYGLSQFDNATDYDKYIAEHIGTPGAKANSHIVKRFNENYYIIVKRGDSFKSIAREMDTSWKKILKYNELDRNAVLHVGDVLWLMKKRSKAPKEFKNRPHIVKAGESMYTIAQMYGIRLKKLYKMNDLDPDYMPKVGDKIRLR